MKPPVLRSASAAERAWIAEQAARRLSPEEFQSYVEAPASDWERENAAAEVRRSFAGDYSPIYQAAYMLGGLQFWALRRELVESGKMTDRAFHDSILKGGPMPVSVVRSRLLEKAPNVDLPAEWRFYPALNKP